MGNLPGSPIFLLFRDLFAADFASFQYLFLYLRIVFWSRFKSTKLVPRGLGAISLMSAFIAQVKFGPV